MKSVNDGTNMIFNSPEIPPVSSLVGQKSFLRFFHYFWP